MRARVRSPGSRGPEKGIGGRWIHRPPRSTPRCNPWSNRRWACSRRRSSNGCAGAEIQPATGCSSTKPGTTAGAGVKWRVAETSSRCVVTARKPAAPRTEESGCAAQTDHPQTSQGGCAVRPLHRLEDLNRLLILTRQMVGVPQFELRVFQPPEGLYVANPFLHQRQPLFRLGEQDVIEALVEKRPAVLGGNRL